MLLHNSATLKILPYSYRSKRDQQKSIVRRFDFSINKDEGERCSLPYKIITQNQSSMFFKRKTNRMIKISELSGNQIGLTRNILTSNGKLPINIGAESTILDFFRSTGIFINIYGIENDKSLAKLDIVGEYAYFNKKLYPTITIDSFNHIEIKFYDNNKYTDFLLEIIYVIKSYNRFNDLQLFKDKLNSTKCPIVYIDGIMWNPHYTLPTNATLFEILDVNENNYIYNSTISVNNNICNIDDKLMTMGYPSCMPICPDNVFLYGSIDDDIDYALYSKSTYVENDYSPRIKTNMDDGEKFCLILGDKDILKNDMSSNLYKLLLELCNEDGTYDYDYVSNIISYEMNKISEDNRKLLLECPKYFAMYLYNSMKDELFVQEINSISKEYLTKRVDVSDDSTDYILFRFNKSMSYTLFYKGKIMTPDHIAETSDYVYLYFNPSKYMTNYILNNPITLVRCRNYANPDMIYRVSASPIYVSKKGYPKYIREYIDAPIKDSHGNNTAETETVVRYTKSDDGTFIYFNNEYVPIDGYTYEYNDKLDIYISHTDNSGSLYRIHAEKYDLPQNKFMERIKNNALLVNEIDDTSGLVLDTPSYIDIEYKYPYIKTVSMMNFQIPRARNKYPSSINQISNESYKDDNTEYDKICESAKNIFNNYLMNIFHDTESYTSLDNYIYNIVITEKDDIYNTYIFIEPFFRYIDGKYISHVFMCAMTPSGNETLNEFISKPRMVMVNLDDIKSNGDIVYIQNDIYEYNKNTLLMNKTVDTNYIYPKVNIDYDYIEYKYKKYINENKSSLDNISDFLSDISNLGKDINDLYLIAIGKYFIIGNITNWINESNEFNCTQVTITGYICGDNTARYIKTDINLEDCFYISKSITDIGLYPAIGCHIPVTWFKELSIYNADSSYSKYDNTNDMIIPHQISKNYDQLMIFKNGLLDESCYLYDDHIISDSVDNLFASNMSKFALYKSINDLRSYMGYVVNVHSGLNKTYPNKEFYHKKIDVMQTPIDLRYMMIFVNGVFMDINHVILLSDNRFMLKNLQDYPDQIHKYTNVLSDMGYYTHKDKIGYKQSTEIVSLNRSVAKTYTVGKKLTVSLEFKNVNKSDLKNLSFKIECEKYDSNGKYIEPYTINKLITSSQVEFVIPDKVDNYKILMTKIYLLQDQYISNISIDWDTFSITEPIQPIADNKYIIQSLDIFSYPFEYVKEYAPYYKATKTFDAYKEYVLNDQYYDKFRSELIAYNIDDASPIYLNNDDSQNSNKFGYLSDFRYRALNKMHHDYPMSYMMHGRGSSLNHLMNYTYGELSEFTHKQLEEKHYVHGYVDTNDDDNDY